MFEQNNVYIDYSENLFTFHKVDNEEKIIEIDLDNCEIKDRENGKDEDVENEIDSKTDLVTLSYFPLGAGCIINHLHFEFLMLDDFGTEISVLPIEERSSNLLFETKLKYKNEKEISMFDGTTTLKVSEIKEPLICWKIECILNQENSGEISAMENLFQNSISHLVNLILTKLIDKEIPHNMVMTNQGRTFYLIPRKFENKKHKINTCWNDLAGLITCKEQKTFDEIKEDEIDKFFKDEVSLESSNFQTLTQDIITQIDSVFEIKKY